MFFKHAIALVILGVAALGLCAQANTVHDTLIAEKPAKGLVPQEWLQRLEKVEGYQQITDTLLANRFDGLANEQKFSFWITLVTLVSIGAGAYFSIRGGMAAEVARIETKIRQQMDQEATRTLEKVTAEAKVQITERINRNLDKTLTELLEEKTKPLIEAANHFIRVEEIKKQAKLLVVGETLDQKEEILKVYSRLGFCNVSFEVMPSRIYPDSFQGSFDLIIFDRNEDVIEDAQFQRMTVMPIATGARILTDNNRHVFIFAKREDEYDSIRKYISFANTTFTLESRLMETLRRIMPLEKNPED